MAAGQLAEGPATPRPERSTITARDGLEMQALEQAIHRLCTRLNQASADLRRAGERQHQRDADNLRLLREKLHSRLEAAASIAESARSRSLGRPFISSISQRFSIEVMMSWRISLSPAAAAMPTKGQTSPRVIQTPTGSSFSSTRVYTTGRHPPACTLTINRASHR